MFTRISNFFKDLLQCSPLTASTPHVPHPPEQGSGDPMPDGNCLYQETSTDIETIAGTQISFGTVEKTTVDQDGNTTHDRRKISHILGDGRLVTSVEPRVEDGLERPGVEGLCRFCLAEAIPEFEAGVISREELQLRGLVSTGSLAQCNQCKRKDVCEHHCQSLERLDGSKPELCPNCREAAVREDRDRQSLYMLLSPFLERKRLPPPHDQESPS
jgi:hypothetical protein